MITGIVTQAAAGPAGQPLLRETSINNINNNHQAHRGGGICCGFAGAVVLAMLMIVTTTHAEIRVGPLNPDLGYPLWYEDDTGLQLDLCTDLAVCFFEPPDPALPVSFPDNFPDESFYWAAESFITGPANPAIGVEQVSKAILVMAREGTFANEAVVPGDQIVFSRLRFFIDGYPAMANNTYRITHPYGTEEFTPEPGDAGPGVKGEGYSATTDIGINVGDFAASTTVFPTFLIPAGMDRATLIASPGAFLDPTGAASVQVSGSPLGTNFFRIEGPSIGLIYPDFQCADATLGIGGPGGGGVKDGQGFDVLTDCVESDLFSIMGRVASLQGVDIERAVYGKGDSDPDPANILPRSFVQVWAYSSESQNLEARMADGTVVPMTEGEGGRYFAQLIEETDYPVRPAGTLNPGPVTVTNVGDIPASAKTAVPTTRILFSQVQPPTWDSATGQLEINLECSNTIDAIAGLQLHTIPSLSFIGSWSATGPGTVQGLFSFTASVPPRAITVTTGDGSSVTGDVQISVALP